MRVVQNQDNMALVVVLNVLRKNKMKKVIKDETLAEIMQFIIKFHGKNQTLSFGDILAIIYGANNPQDLTDSQVLELTKEAYENNK